MTQLVPITLEHFVLLHAFVAAVAVLVLYHWLTKR